MNIRGRDIFINFVPLFPISCLPRLLTTHPSKKHALRWRFNTADVDSAGVNTWKSSWFYMVNNIWASFGCSSSWYRLRLCADILEQKPQNIALLKNAFKPVRKDTRKLATPEALASKILNEDAVAEFNNALDTVAKDELEPSDQRGATTTTTGDDSSNTLSAFESLNIAASIIPPENLQSTDGTDAMDRNASCAAADFPGEEKESGDYSSHARKWTFGAD